MGIKQRSIAKVNEQSKRRKKLEIENRQWPMINNQWQRTLENTKWKMETEVGNV